MRIALLASFTLPPLALSGCKVEQNADREAKARLAARAQANERRVRATCASDATNARLKQVLFDAAIRARNADPANLDKLATYSAVRIEDPTVRSRDEALDITVCGGSLILQLPPGAGQAFGGQHKLQAEVEYAAQAAADGSGLVYRIKGAEPIIDKLAAFDLRGQSYRAPASQAAVTDGAPRIFRPTAAATAPQPPSPPQVDVPTPRTARTYPSFDCRRARTRSERLVCADGDLAALDRAMSSQFYSALSNADRATRAELRRSRDRFLAYRDQCPTVACVDAAYRDRMEEIRDISGN